jgi:hypothetical protein
MRKRELKIPACKDGCKAWHNVNQVAALLSMSRRMIYRLMREGSLPYRKGSQSRFVYHPNIDHFMRGEPFEQVEQETQETPKRDELPANSGDKKSEPVQLQAACEASPAEARLVDEDSSKRREKVVMKNSKTTGQANILTPRVRRAQFELISALRESIESAGLDRTEAESKLSEIMADVWVAAEEVAARLPAA